MNIEPSNLKAFAGAALLVLCWVTASLASADEQKVIPMPELIWATDGIERQIPFFVRSDRVLLPDGKLDKSLFGRGAQITIQEDILESDVRG